MGGGATGGGGMRGCGGTLGDPIKDRGVPDIRGGPPMRGIPGPCICGNGRALLCASNCSIRTQHSLLDVTNEYFNQYLNQ